MGNFWKGKKVLVTGGTGFIGSYVCELLLNYGADITTISKSGKYDNLAHIVKEIKIIRADLRDFERTVELTKKQEIILNLASKVAGIHFNLYHPVEMFYENVAIARNVLEAACRNGAERFLAVSSACVYSRKAKIPNVEPDGFNDDPEPSNLGYGWSKRVNELLGRFYTQEYGMKIAIVRPFNAYGPRDNFDLESSHVIPGLITRIYSGENPLAVWGSGNQTRSFIYVSDIAKGLIAATEKYAGTDPINIAANEEISIGNLARMIIKFSGKKTKIFFDKSKPEGQFRRSGDTKKALKELNFKAEIKLTDGIKKTLQWYEQRLSS